jgi:Flp pilus assembly protein CpaB
MRRGRILILLALIILIGAIGGFFVLRSLGGGGGGEAQFEGTPAPEQVFTAQIVFAAQDISRGAEITADAVILSPFPANNVIETMVTDTSVVVGKYARMDIARGVPITLNMFTDQPGTLLGVGSEASIAIPDGMTAISIPMPEATNGVAYAVRDGDKVDVLVSMPVLDQDTDFQTVLPNLTSVLVSSGAAEEAQRILTASANLDTAVHGRIETEPVTGQLLYVIPSEGQQPRLVTQRLIENATVLHVGEFALVEEQVAAAPAAEGVGAETPQEGAPVPAPPKPKIITLIVTPQEALSLHWAAESGINLTLTLRAPNDTTDINTTSVTLQYLLDTYSITVPTKLPFRVQPSVTPVMP